MKARIRPVLASLLSMLAGIPAAIAYDVPTHNALAQEAARLSTKLGGVLSEDLGFAGPSETTFLGKRPIEWIGEGAGFEDLPPWRVVNHFHNPLMAWEQSGLRILDRATGASSVWWGQAPAQDSIENAVRWMGGTWSWPTARRAFLRALTGEGADQRAEAFAETFRALGQLTHLIQDATVPAHVRNDPHLSIPLPFNLRIPLDPDPYEDWVDNTLRRDRGQFDSMSRASRPSPARSVFGPTGDDRAPAPVAGLIDTRTVLGQRADLLAGAAIGAAEYTNGNFLSKDTKFHPDFPLPSLAGVDLESPVSVAEGQKARRYFRKNREGGLVDPFVAEGLLHDVITQGTGGPLPGGFTLDARVSQEYARHLLPRAVAYSTELIDHFFRGKLDVDLVADATDPTIVRLVGVNRSDEALGGGTLTLYADESGGRRTAAVPQTPPDIGPVPPGGRIESVWFQLPDKPQAFTVVYQGALGHESASADRSSPGAVIGKRLGIRVEEVFNDGARWFLRNPRGFLSLRTDAGPLAVDAYKEVKWGDAPNALIARTGLGPGQPNLIVTYEVPRQIRGGGTATNGASEASEGAGVATDGVASELALVPRSSTPFPFETIVARVDLTQTVQYRQRLARFDHTVKHVWNDVPDGPNKPGFYQLSTDISPLTLETVNEQALPFSDGFLVVLDLDHYYPSFGAPFPDPYFWWLQDIALDASGRPLGLVVVFLHRPRNGSTRLPFYGLTRDGALEKQAEYEVQFGFPPEVMPLLWALVDLSHGTVVASTAEPNIMLASQASLDPWAEAPASMYGGAWMHVIEDFVGGPSAGHAESWVRVGLRTPGQVSGSVTSRSEERAQVGEQVPTLGGWMRADVKEALTAQGLLAVQGGSSEGASDYVYDCVDNACSAVTVRLTQDQVTNRAIQFWEARRTRPTPAGERLVLLGLVEQDFGSTGNLVVWDPAAQAVQVPLRLGTGAHTLGPATSSTALVSSVIFEPFGEGTSLAFLDRGADPVFFPDVDLTIAYTLIEPAYVYSLQDQQFHKPRTLDPIGWPAPLAAAPGNAGSDYHAISDAITGPSQPQAVSP